VFAAVSKNRAAVLVFHDLNARAAADAPSQKAHEYSSKNSIHFAALNIQIKIS
jgi:predicted ribonuclease YlaK